MSEVTNPTELPELNGPSTGSRPPRRAARFLGLALLVLAVLTAFYGVLFWLGLRSGAELREENIRQELAGQVERQMTLAQSDFENGNYELVLRRLDWVLLQEPSLAAAAALQDEAQTALNVRLTPTVTPTPAPTATGTPAPVPDLREDLRAIQRYILAESWPAAIDALLSLQVENPDYQRRLTDQLLYQAYVGYGTALLPGEQIELGLFYLSQAERLGDLSPAVLDQRFWAQLYLTGIAFYGVDWSATVFYFRDLCLVAPFYQDSCGKLYVALVSYGDQYAETADWCPAVTLYREARLYGIDETLNDKISDAIEGCLSATPTPDPDAPEVITDTVDAPSQATPDAP